MKRILFIAAMLMFMFCINVSALTLEEYNLTVNLGDEYSVLTKDNISRNEELVSSLGHSVTSMTQYWNKNSLILFAVNKTKSRQLQVVCKETEFSKNLGDMSYLSDDDALSFVNRFVTVKTVADLSLVTLDDTKYYEIVSSDTDSGGEFNNVQYVTVRNGLLYTFSFFESGSENLDVFLKDAQDMLMDIKVINNKRATATSTENITEIIFVSLLIIFAGFVVFWIIFTFVRDFYQKPGGAKISRRKH